MAKSGEVIIALSADTAGFEGKVQASGKELDKFKGKVAASKAPLASMKDDLGKAAAGAEGFQKVVTGGAFAGAFMATAALVKSGLDAIASFYSEEAARVNAFVEHTLSQIKREKDAYKELHEFIRKTNQEAELILSGEKREDVSSRIALENAVKAEQDKAKAELLAAQEARSVAMAQAEQAKKSYSGNNVLSYFGDLAFGPSEQERIRNATMQMKVAADLSAKAEADIKSRSEQRIAAIEKNAALEKAQRDKAKAREVLATDRESYYARAKAQADYLKTIRDMDAQTRDEMLRANGEGGRADREALGRDTQNKQAAILGGMDRTNAASIARAAGLIQAEQRRHDAKLAIMEQSLQRELKDIDTATRQARIDSAKEYHQQIEDMQAQVADSQLRRQGKVLEAETAAIKRETEKQQRAILAAAMSKMTAMSVMTGGIGRDLVQAQGLIQELGKVQDERLAGLMTAQKALPTAVERRFDFHLPNDSGNDPQVKVLSQILAQLKSDPSGKAATELLKKISSETLTAVGF